MGRTWVEWLGEEDLVKLQPLAFLELTVLLDQSGIRFPKRKPHKRKRKEGQLVERTYLGVKKVLNTVVFGQNN